MRVGPSLVVVEVEGSDDCELEVWAARRKRELFEKLFGRDLEVVDGRPTGDHAALDAALG